MALAKARARYGNAEQSRAYWQGILDGTGRSVRRGLRGRSRDTSKDAKNRLFVLARGVAQLAGLEAVQAKLPAAQADIQAATAAERQRAEQIRQETAALAPPPRRPEH